MTPLEDVMRMADRTWHRPRVQWWMRMRPIAQMLAHFRQVNPQIDLQTDDQSNGQQNGQNTGQNKGQSNGQSTNQVDAQRESRRIGQTEKKRA